MTACRLHESVHPPATIAVHRCHGFCCFRCHCLRPAVRIGRPRCPVLIEGAEALLVLGGEDRTQRHRSRTAVRHYLACRAAGVALPRLLVTGGLLACPEGTHPDTPVSEAACMARFMQSQGVPAAHIVQEAQALDTLGNVALGGALAAQLGLQRLLLVSDDFHLWRARRLFERVWGHAPAGCLGTGHTGTLRLRLREKLAFGLQMAALRQAGVEPGHSGAHLRFVVARAAQPL